MNKLKIFITLSTPLTITPFITSCSSSTFVSNDVYIIEKNESNPYFNKIPLYGQEFSERKTIHDSLTGNYLIRWKYEGESVYDSLNSYFKETSKKRLSFGLAKQIIIFDDKNKFIFDDDDSDGKMLNNIKEDYGAGFLNPVYKQKSQNNKSINSDNFINKLKIAKKITFVLKDNLFFYNYLGEKTQHKIDAHNLLYSLKKCIKDQEKNYLNALGFTNTILKEENFKNNTINFDIDNKKLRTELFINEIIKNKAFSFIFQEKIKENTDISKFLYAGSYVLNKCDLEKMIYISINKYTQIKKVIIKYNAAGSVDINSYRNHLLNSFNQGLISSQNISIFNDSQQANILSLYDNGVYKLNIINNTKNESPPLFYDDCPNFENTTFSKNYAILMYGKEYLKKIDYNNFYNGLGFIFRNNISQIINKYTLSYTYNKTQYYDNFINPYAKISNNKNSNYTNIKSAFPHVIKDKLFLYNNTSSKLVTKDYFVDENFKHYYSIENIKDITKQFKSCYFDEIRNSIKKILDKFYEDNNLNNKEIIEFDIPFLDYLDKKIIDTLDEIFKSIDKRLKINIKVDKNIKNIQKMGYKIINFEDTDTNSFLTSLLLSKQNNLILNLIHYNSDINCLEKLNQFKNYFFEKLNFNNDDINELKSKTLDEILQTISKKNQNKNINYLIETLVSKYHYDNSYFHIILLINDIKNSYAAPYRIDRYINLNLLLNYELIQSHFSKPTREDDLVYFEDIKILSR
ncbi:OppA family ABC transporter substrate-binding lipoprotein [Mycoplasma elephantis]|uniref:OppA family ABC transporter substrate-binding lipoprotein n=1 Tax=Mycoplasma elephantis TaxID=114882 RepID=UPI000483BBCC|nr:hypothetical protein [Mycoplasma elephantis]